MTEDAPDGLGQTQVPAPESLTIPVSVISEPSADVLNANSQHINLAPENHIDPNATKAEVSTDERFRYMNPNRAQTLLGEKIYHTTIKEFLFKDVDPVDQSVRSEHQFQTGWSKDRSGKTESGTEVHVRIGESTSYVVEREPYYQQELYEHQDGTEISVTYEPAPGERRSVHYYMTGRGRGEGEKDVPEHITIFDSKANQPLVLTRWSNELRGPDPRFSLALQEMGTLLDQRIEWFPPNNGGDSNGPPSDLGPTPPDQGPMPAAGPVVETSGQIDPGFATEAQNGIAEIPVTQNPPPHDAL
jgi:hypothetical protein